MIVYPHCKINLGLNIISRRPDGYHDIESVFYPVPWCDLLEVIPSEKTGFFAEGISINCSPENNLCIKAYRLLKSHYTIPEISIFLYKQIPFGAGLGGGSSDGAFMMKALNELFKLDLGEKTLMSLASELGSDCSFFIQDKPCLVTGTGNVLTPLPFTLKGHFLVIVKPGVIIPTATAYGFIEPRIPSCPLSETVYSPVTEWKGKMFNGFEGPVFSRYPQIKEIKDKLYQKNALYASMSGSGSAVYGIFEKETDITSEFPGCVSWYGFLL